MVAPATPAVVAGLPALDAGCSWDAALTSLAGSGENRIATAAVTHDAWVLTMPGYS